MAAWQRRFGRDATGHLSVNVSSRQFADATLLDEVRGVLRETGLTPSSLKLEITESAFIGDVDAAQTTLMHMQAMGVAWSLDDFGTGYSSLSYLHRLAIDTVKVDRSFVQGMGVEENGSKMVHAIITLAHNLGMDVVAEGVETAAQAEELRELGCDYAQGFFYSEPLPAKSVDSLMLRQPWRTDRIPVRR
jgi:EAL domain-containing protein (putative c-di-GMP-specific phosphodiesterase class I)